MRIDLHTHSTASDGTDTPAGLVAAAARAGLDVVAITDHDTTSGWQEAEAALPAGLALVRGMEMSCLGHGADGYPVAVHLLAYLFDPGHAAFAAERKRPQLARRERIQLMAQRMRADGIPVDPDAILAGAGNVVGRPHLARALVDLGVVETIGDAFLHHPSPRGPYYARMADTWLDDAVAMVRSAGGVPVLAHALARKRGRVLDLDHIRSLAESGQLAGLEVQHPDHAEEDAAILARLAARHGLITTGSSDYHGGNKTIALGARTTDVEQFDELVARASGAAVIQR
ncbi:PHP domain-containing protein [Hoyosella sp. G463]|uniref:PHP domain-containing protein n=1 Tax=Lolliginicoccus lacisalsi TaxID=2742202 RepID=A0A927JEH4_9ACTN|nr:PHP domain-containing protein [Lolliginicoccus lacisalsi]MBD8507794.1 PHP domain-containing protein [Lolliginicoccus lacisalsi]